MAEHTFNEPHLDEMTYTAKYVSDLVEKSWDITRDGDRQTNAAWSSEIDAFLDNQTLKALFFGEDWVFITVDLLANKLSSQLMTIFKTEIEDDKEIVTPDPTHPLNQMIENPNPWQDYHTYMYNAVVELFLMGNLITWNNRRDSTSLILPADQVNMTFNADNTVKEYIVGAVSIDNQGLVALGDKTLVFPADEIMHIRRPNPASLLWGLSPFVPGRKSVLFNRYSTDYLNAFYVKQATPGMVVEFGKNVNEKNAVRQLRAMEIAHSGRGNQRRTMMLPQGVTAKPITHTLSDQKLIEHINANRETILGLLKVPKHEVALQETGSLGSEEHKIALRNFWESTLIPAARQISSGFTKFFKKDLGPDFQFKFDLENVEALQEDKLRKAETALKLLEAGYTINEVREMLGKEASDHALANTPKPLLPNAGAVAPNVSPRVDNESTFSWDILGEDEIDGILTKAGTNLTIQTKQLDDEVSEVQDEFVGFILDQFIDIGEIVIKTFKDLATESPPSKGLKTKAAEVDRRKLRTAIRRAVQDLEDQYVNKQSDLLQSSVEFGYDTQLRFVLNADGLDELTALRARDLRRRRLLLESRGLSSFSQITKTHTERIMKEIAVGVQNKETIPQITRRIAQTFADADAMFKKATTIARTETLTAVSQGQWAAVKNAEEVIPNLTKIWLTAGDERVRSSHTNNNGVRLPINEKFANGLRYPRDPRGDGSETINCRCTLVMVPGDQDPGSIPEDVGAENNPPSRSGRR